METTKKALEEVSGILDRYGWSDKSIQIGGNVTNSQVAQTILNSQNVISQQPAGEQRALLEKLQSEVRQLIEKLPAEKSDEAVSIAKKLDIVAEQATSKTPEREWYSLSAKGLMEAAKFVKDFTGDIGGTLLNLGKLKFGGGFKLPEIS